MLLRGNVDCLSIVPLRVDVLVFARKGIDPVWAWKISNVVLGEYEANMKFASDMIA